MNDSQGIALQLSEWAAMGDWRLMFLDRDRVRNTTAPRRLSARRCSI
jgi:zinc protease